MKNFIVVLAITSGLFLASCGNQNDANGRDGNAPAGTTGAGNETENVINDNGVTNQQNGQLPPANDSFVNSVPTGSANDGTGSRGSALIATQNCKTCHQVENKNIGPSYRAIAQKYPDSEGGVDNLASAIVNGAVGQWGQTRMPAYHNVSIADARDMARWILSLNSSVMAQDTTSRIK